MEEGSPALHTEVESGEEWPEKRRVGDRAAAEEEQEVQGSVEEEEELEMESGGGRSSEEGGGYACRICGFHAGDVQGLSQHLHTVHPVSGLPPLSTCQQQPVAQGVGSLSIAPDGDPGSGMRSEREDAGFNRNFSDLPPPGPVQLPPLPSGEPLSEGSGHNRAAVVCLPLVAEGLKLLWTRSDETRELDGVQELVRAFNAFPYPTPAEAASLARSCGLPLDSVKVWFMVQRVRYGISWASEEIEETRRKLSALQGWQAAPPTLAKAAGEDAEICSYSPKFWGSDRQQGLGGAMSSVMQDFLFRRKRDRQTLGISGGLDPAPSPLFVVAPPGCRGPSVRGRKSKLQLRALRRSFVRNNWLSEAELQRLLGETGLSRGEVRKWFSDSRYQLRNNGHRPVPPAAGAGAPSAGREASQPENDMEDDPVVSVESTHSAPAESPNDVGDWSEGAREKVGDLGEKGASYPPSPVLLTSRGRLRKTKSQLAVLKQFFLRCQWPTSADYTQLVHQTGLPRPDVIQWFGDARYRVKNGNLRWVRSEREHDQIMAEIAHGDRRRSADNSGGGGSGELQGAEPLRSGRGTAVGGADVRPLELFWQQTGAGPGEADLSTLSSKSGMSVQQVRDWFSCQESGMAEVEVNISD
ncbi:hypothetical protein GJAV_G00156100 [Gymnothorax javanicus]|nr:hypothetical protein GJAV_G00156100 [Gymnothorax javanicus]